MEPQRLLSIQEVQNRLGGLSRSTIYRLIRSGELERPKRVSARRVAWSVTSIDLFLASRPPAGNHDDP